MTTIFTILCGRCLKQHRDHQLRRARADPDNVHAAETPRQTKGQGRGQGGTELTTMATETLEMPVEMQIVHARHATTTPAAPRGATQAQTSPTRPPRKGRWTDGGRKAQRSTADRDSTQQNAENNPCPAPAVKKAPTAPPRHPLSVSRNHQIPRTLSRTGFSKQCEQLLQRAVGAFQ